MAHHPLLHCAFAFNVPEGAKFVDTVIVLFCG
jgi:hypothetical protein